jgi:hypothetical protein
MSCQILLDILPESLVQIYAEKYTYYIFESLENDHCRLI